MHCISIRRGVRLAGIVAILLPSLGDMAFGQSLGGDDDALLQRVRELEAAQVRDRETIAALSERIEQLRPADDVWISERRAEDIREIVTDVLVEADTRASLLAGGADAGWDNGFYLASLDGTFRLNVGGTVQVAFIGNWQESSPDDDDRYGFQNRRSTIRLSGHVVDPTWQYVVQGDFAVSGGGLELLDAFVRKSFDNGLSVRAGKFRMPFNHEQLVGYNNLLAVERSLIAGAFGVGRSQGVEARWTGDHLRAFAAVNDGLGSIVGATAPSLAEDTEYAVTGRIDLLLGGAFDDFTDYIPSTGDEFGVMIGAAVHYQEDEYGTTANEMSILRWTADVTADLRQVNLMAAVSGNHTDGDTPAGSLDQIGVVVQAGWRPCEAWQMFGRWEWADADGAGSDLNVATIGVVRYFNGNGLKWTTDVGYGFDPVSAQFASTVKGWREDAPGENGQMVIRSQLQLVF